jgi:tetratricopeptide (TPR) repeat protein
VLATAAALPLAFSPDPDLLERLTSATAAPSRPDDKTVGYFEQSIAALRRAEDATGASRPLWNTTRSQLTEVVSLAKGAAAGAQAPRLVSLAAQYALFLGWMRNAAGDYPAALAWYDRALDWAMDARDATMTVTALSGKALLAHWSGDPWRCIRLGSAALEYRGRVSPGAAALAAAYTARGYAATGDQETMQRLLGDADDQASAAASRVEDEPDYLYWVPSHAAGQRGIVETLAGSHEAVASLTVALQRTPESFTCDRAEDSAYLARAHAQLGDAERAEDITVRTAELSADVPRARAELVKVAGILDGAGAIPQARTVRDALAAHPVRA